MTHLVDRLKLVKWIVQCEFDSHTSVTYSTNGRNGLKRVRAETFNRRFQQHTRLKDCQMVQSHHTLAFKCCISCRADKGAHLNLLVFLSDTHRLSQSMSG